jgi:hypothetical protein
MFQGFQKARGFNGFPRKGFGTAMNQWNGYPCDFWLDASQGVTNPVNLAQISNWRDVISGVNFTQTVSGSQPRYLSSDPAFNNHPVIDASVSAVRRLTNQQSILRTDNSFCIAIVAQAVGVNGRCVILSRDGVNVGELNIGGTDSGADKLGIYNGASGVFTSSTIGYSTSPIILLLSNSQILINGTSETVSGAEAAGLSSIITFNRIFGNGLTGTTAKLAEVLFFPFDPTTLEMIEISNILNAKYAIY